MSSHRKILIALVATVLVPMAAIAANISVSTVNGQTTVTWNGKRVWSGETTGQVTGKASAINGKEYGAAFEGTKVLWESEKGAAGKLK